MAASAGLVLLNILIFFVAWVMLAYALPFRRQPPIRWLIILIVSFCIVSFCTLNIYVNESLEARVFFSRMRFLGLGLLAPSWIIFLSAVYNRWMWLQKKWITAIVFGPGVLTALFSLFPVTQDLVVTNFSSYQYAGVLAVRFESGGWFQYYYGWAMILVFASFVLSGYTFLKETKLRRRQVLALTLGSMLAAGIDIYCVLTNSSLRWLMLASGTFLFSQLGIMYSVFRHKLLNLVPFAMGKVFQKIPDPVLVIDENKKILSANEAAIQLFSLKDNCLGQDLSQALGGISLLPGELVLTDKEQKNLFFHVIFENLETDSENLFGKIIFLREISLQKGIELRLNENLEFKARLLALLAHDLSGYMESQTLLSMSLQEGLHPEKLTHAKLLTNSVQTSSDLVSNMMSWAKTQSQGFKPDKRSFEWNALINECIEQLQTQLTQKKITILFDSEQKPFLAEGDSNMLQSVMRNIITNSIRASADEESIHIHLKCQNGRAVISVKDHGCGMNESQLEAIRLSTQSFFAEGISEANGSGLGLMIVRHFISLHDGDFQIHSRLGLGTEVSFNIPF